MKEKEEQEEDTKISTQCCEELCSSKFKLEMILGQRYQPKEQNNVFEKIEPLFNTEHQNLTVCCGGEACQKSIRKNYFDAFLSKFQDKSSNVGACQFTIIKIHS